MIKIDITSDKITYNKITNVVEAEGKVKLKMSSTIT